MNSFSWTLSQPCSAQEWARLSQELRQLCEKGLPLLREGLVAPAQTSGWIERHHHAQVRRVNQIPYSWDTDPDDGARIVLGPSPYISPDPRERRDQSVRVFRLPHTGRVAWGDSLHGWAWAGWLYRAARAPGSPWSVRETTWDAQMAQALTAWAVGCLKSE